jgi:hypothetical protein
MPEIIQREFIDTDPLQYLGAQIQSARASCQPISKFSLAETLSERTGMPIDQAHLLVDAYCEEHEAHIPDYLGGEFNLFWPKVLAFGMALAGIGIFRYAVYLRSIKQSSWIWMMVGTVVFGLGALQWVRSLESYRTRSESKRKEKQPQE